MKIHPTELLNKEGMAVISAKIEFANPIPDVPDHAWYAFPSEYAEYLSEGSEPFTSALLLVAMFWGEDLEIYGPVSPKFAYGLIEYQRVFHIWFPETFKQVDIRFEHIRQENIQNLPASVATAFSGGVDSSYTLRSNLPQNQVIREFQITHGLFIHGFDIELNEVAAYKSARKKYDQIFKDLQLELVPAQTNMRMFSMYRMDWGIMSGGCLIGAGLALEGLFRRYYIPSGYPYQQILPNGNSPLVDHLLSTETTDIVHHGAHKRHFEKMAELSDWKVAQKNLRVCIAVPKPLNGENCSVCNKCLANTVRFELMGVHGKFETFNQPFSRVNFIRWWFIALIGTPTIKEILRLALSKRRLDIIAGMLLVWVGSIVNQTIRSLARSLLSEDSFYQKKISKYGRQRGEIIKGLF